MSGGNPFDLNKVDPLPWDKAAANTSTDQLAEFFRDLYEANELWASREREAALAALRAIAKFTIASEMDWRGRFSRPLAILELELRNSLKPQPGNILAAPSKQSVGRGRRDAINYLQAAAAYTTECLGRPVDSALRQVGEVLREHQFPPEDFSGGTSTRITTRAGEAKITRLAGKVKEWRKGCKDGSSKAAKYFDRFSSQSRCNRSTALYWLSGELEHAGFENSRWHHPTE